MGKYSFDQSSSRRGPAEVHPIWRGVGFVLIVMIPILAYAASDVLIRQNLAKPFFQMPGDLIARPGMLLFNGDPYLYLRIIFTVAIAMVLFAIFTFFVFIINSAFAPPRYGPYDVPPIKARVTKKAR